jgi:hypothetical protein
MASSTTKQTKQTKQGVQLGDTMLASALSGALARIPMHPMDTVKAKLQVATKGQYRGVAHALQHTLRHEGVRGLYRGFGITFVGSAPATCLYFTSYELSKRALSQYTPGLNQSSPFLCNFASGLMAETAACVLFVPIDVVKERLQVQSNLARQSKLQGGSGSGSGSKPLLRYRGAIHACRTIARQEGLRGIYKGYGATVASFGPFSAVYLSVYEKLKELSQRTLEQRAWMPSNGALPLPALLLSGGSAGAFASFVTNPLDLAKLRIQVQRGNTVGFAFNYRNVLHGMLCIARTDGITGLFKGAGARMRFHAPATAITIASYDSFKQMLLQARQDDNDDE